MMNSKILNLFLFLIGTLSCSTSSSYGQSQPISHEIFDQLLKNHVDDEGWVDYSGLKQKRVKLDQYLELLSSNHPNEEHWSKDEQLAYWINAYNAFTLDLVLRHYPVNSIKDIKNGIPFVNTVWDIKFINIEGNEYDLNNIEHGIIRKHFDEPRIHFAVNCASYSCPKLMNRAFNAERLDDMLDNAAISFINDPKRNIIADKSTAQLSSILNWYSGDFTQEGDIISYVNKYARVKLESEANISYLKYNWQLNDIKNR